MEGSTVRVNMMAWKLFNPTVNRVTSGNQLDKPRFVNRSRVYSLQNTLANIIIKWCSAAGNTIRSNPPLWTPFLFGRVIIANSLLCPWPGEIEPLPFLLNSTRFTRTPR